jgi:hypothetical protein
MSSAEDQKRAVGEAAAALVEDGMVVGLGTGSTAVWFVKALGARALKITGVATSTSTAELAASAGIAIAELGETRRIDLTVDGADEIGPGLSLIKGGGVPQEEARRAGGEESQMTPLSAHPRESGDPGVFLFSSVNLARCSPYVRRTEKNLGPRFRGEERGLD